MKLAAPEEEEAAPVPAQPSVQPTEQPDSGFGGDMSAEQPSSDDKPFDDEPFDAGVEADEESDPKKFIEQLTGKLGQSLRKYNDAQGQPDFDLEKFAINSLLSATHTSEMDANDQGDIIKKVKTAGNSDNDDSDDSNDSDGEVSDELDDMGGEIDDLGDEIDNFDEEDSEVNENNNIFLDKPKKNNMFQPNSNDVLDESQPCWSGYKQVGMKTKNGKEVPNCVPMNEGSKLVGGDLIVNENISIFNKTNIRLILKETFNQEEKDMTDQVEEPAVKPAPTKTPSISPTPSRRNKPFSPMPNLPPAPPKFSK